MHKAKFITAIFQTDKSTAVRKILRKFLTQQHTRGRAREINLLSVAEKTFWVVINSRTNTQRFARTHIVIFRRIFTTVSVSARAHAPVPKKSTRQSIPRNLAAPSVLRYYTSKSIVSSGARTKVQQGCMLIYTTRGAITRLVKRGTTAIIIPAVDGPRELPKGATHSRERERTERRENERELKRAQGGRSGFWLQEGSS